ncbi:MULTISPECIES: hypothetical protein [unclassified Bartonella]|uniref:hypothetical protein n=1 Tax=unclassified Bartonella TaxID=2645622 RepID=UPI0035CF7E05
MNLQNVAIFDLLRQDSVKRHKNDDSIRRGQCTSTVGNEQQMILIRLQSQSAFLLSFAGL